MWIISNEEFSSHTNDFKFLHPSNADSSIAFKVEGIETVSISEFCKAFALTSITPSGITKSLLSPAYFNKMLL